MYEDSAREAVSLEGLVLPPRLKDNQRALAARYLGTIPVEHRQPVLDELSGRTVLVLAHSACTGGGAAASEASCAAEAAQVAASGTMPVRSRQRLAISVLPTVRTSAGGVGPVAREFIDRSLGCVSR